MFKSLKLKKIFKSKIKDSLMWGTSRSDVYHCQRQGSSSFIDLRYHDRASDAITQIEIPEDEIPGIIKTLAQYYKGDLIRALTEE